MTGFGPERFWVPGLVVIGETIGNLKCTSYFPALSLSGNGAVLLDGDLGDTTARGGSRSWSIPSGSGAPVTSRPALSSLWTAVRHSGFSSGHEAANLCSARGTDRAERPGRHLPSGAYRESGHHQFASRRYQVCPRHLNADTCRGPPDLAPEFCLGACSLRKLAARHTLM